MLNRQVFNELLNIVAEVQTEITEETMLYAKLIEDFDGVPRNLAKFEGDLVDTIQNAMNGDELVSWWVYDCFCGEVPLTTTINGEELVIDSMDMLYDVIQAKVVANTGGN